MRKVFVAALTILALGSAQAACGSDEDSGGKGGTGGSKGGTGGKEGGTGGKEGGTGGSTGGTGGASGGTGGASGGTGGTAGTAGGGTAGTDGGGTAGTTGDSGLNGWSAECLTCLQTSCATQVTACNGNAKCAACSTTDYTAAGCSTNQQYKAICECAANAEAGTPCHTPCGKYCA